MKTRLEKKLAIVKKSTLVGFKRKGSVLDGRYTVKYSVKFVAKGKTKLKTRLQGIYFHCFMMCFGFQQAVKNLYIFRQSIEVILLKRLFVMIS